MDILKTVQNEEGKIDENKLTTVLEEYKDLLCKVCILTLKSNTDLYSIDTLSIRLSWSIKND
jgi:hypothetical protein